MTRAAARQAADKQCHLLAKVHAMLARYMEHDLLARVDCKVARNGRPWARGCTYPLKADLDTLGSVGDAWQRRF